MLVFQEETTMAQQDVHELRALIALRVIGEFEAEYDRMPYQRELLAPEDGDDRSLFDRVWECLGLDQAVSIFGLAHTSQLVKAVTRLRDCGLMIPTPDRDESRRSRSEGERASVGRAGYGLTDAGRELAARLDDDWQNWPSLEEVCDG